MKSKIATLAILFLIFVLAFAIRYETAKYGELNEFDPFWNYKATSYLVDNGWTSYKEWQDTDSWVGCELDDCLPYYKTDTAGRNVSATSQEALHLTTAFLYNFYDGDLYTFVILIPAIFGALTVFPMFILITKLSNSARAGLLGSFFFAVTFSILMRNSAGWFKSEPLGLLLGLTFLAGLTLLIHQNKINYKIIIGSVLVGLTMTFAISSWVGSVMLILPVLVFGLIIPIFAKESKGLGQIIMMVGASSLIPLLIFERTEALFLPLSLGIVGLGMYIWLCHKLNKKLKTIILVAVILLTVGALMSSGVSDRYKATLLPFHESDDIMVQSVAEHQLPTLEQMFYMQGFYIFLAPIGFILYMKKFKTYDKIWMLSILGVLMYFGMTLIRLQMIMSVAMIIMSAIGAIMIIDDLKKSKHNPKLKSIGFTIVLIITILPFTIMWIDMSDNPPAILNGGTPFPKLTNEWLMAMDFISTLEPDATIFAWWDYGYWISVLGERGTFMDNSTLYTHKILEYAKLFAMNPQDAHDELQSIGADYVLVYSTTMRQGDMYNFIVGGDDLKSFWIFTLAGQKDHKLDNYFFTQTLMGAMIPFAYTDDGKLQMADKFIDGFKLVYMSPSYSENEEGIRYGILIYKVLER